MPRATVIILLGILVSGLTGCAHDDRSQSSGSETAIIDSKNLLAFRQQEEADLVVDFLDWYDLRVDKPALGIRPYRSPVTKADFLRALNSSNLQRHFAVVVMDKRWSIAAQRVSLDELEAFMRGVGFQRIVFQQARGDSDPKTGLPILRDTAQ
jgi:hypothetical protein